MERTISSSDLVITGESISVQEDSVFCDILPVFCDPSHLYPEGGFQVVVYVLDIFLHQLPGIDPMVGVTMLSSFHICQCTRRYVVCLEDETANFQVYLDPFLNNAHDLFVDVRDVSNDVQYVGLDETTDWSGTFN